MVRFCLLILIVSTQSLLAQQFDYFEGKSNLEVKIDHRQGNNIWQKGPPQKEIFNAPYSGDNVIVTDTIQAYPNDKHSSFILKIEPPTLEEFPYIVLLFRQQLDVDSLHAGAWIDASYDKGNTWTNIYADTTYRLKVLGFAPEDTLFNGQIGFATNTKDWEETYLLWGDLPWDMPLKEEEVLVRFNFAADSLAKRREGWMIDDIEIFEQIGRSFEEINQMGNEEVVLTYPNPMYEQVNIFYKIKEKSKVRLDVTTMRGKVMYSVDMGEKEKGLYSGELHQYDMKFELPSTFLLKLYIGDRKYSRKILRGTWQN